MLGSVAKFKRGYADGKDVCRPPKCNFYGAVGFKSNCWSGPAEGAQSTALKEKADYSCAGEELKKGHSGHLQKKEMRARKKAVPRFHSHLLL